MRNMNVEYAGKYSWNLNLCVLRNLYVSSDILFPVNVVSAFSLKLMNPKDSYFHVSQNTAMLIRITI